MAENERLYDLLYAKKETDDPDQERNKEAIDALISSVSDDDFRRQVINYPDVFKDNQGSLGQAGSLGEDFLATQATYSKGGQIGIHQLRVAACIARARWALEKLEIDKLKEITTEGDQDVLARITDENYGPQSRHNWSQPEWIAHFRYLAKSIAIDKEIDEQKNLCESEAAGVTYEEVTALGVGDGIPEDDYKSRANDVTESLVRLKGPLAALKQLATDHKEFLGRLRPEVSNKLDEAIRSAEATMQLVKAQGANLLARVVRKFDELGADQRISAGKNDVSLSHNFEEAKKKFATLEAIVNLMQAGDVEAEHLEQATEKRVEAKRALLEIEARYLNARITGEAGSIKSLAGRENFDTKTPEGKLAHLQAQQNRLKVIQDQYERIRNIRDDAAMAGSSQSKRSIETLLEQAEEQIRIAELAIRAARGYLRVNGVKESELPEGPRYVTRAPADANAFLAVEGTLQGMFKDEVIRKSEKDKGFMESLPDAPTDAGAGAARAVARVVDAVGTIKYKGVVLKEGDSIRSTAVFSRSNGEKPARGIIKFDHTGASDMTPDDSQLTAEENAWMAIKTASGLLNNYPLKEDGTPKGSGLFIRRGTDKDQASRIFAALLFLKACHPEYKDIKIHAAPGVGPETTFGIPHKEAFIKEYLPGITKAELLEERKKVGQFAAVRKELRDLRKRAGDDEATDKHSPKSGSNIEVDDEKFKLDDLEHHYKRPKS